MVKKISIAVLMTCHNRRDKTLECLDLLFKSNLPDNIILKVFLVDDGSTDGTESAVREKFPQVNLIKGNGFLFWNQGMRLAWNTAVKYSKYDFYIWLNDDTLLDENAINDLLDYYDEALNMDGRSALIVGSCRVPNSDLEFSYGGRTKKGRPVKPNGQLQECTLINGNIVLIPKDIYNVIGNLSSDYTHGIGDNDYGIQVIKMGYKCYTSKKYIAICPRNGSPSWSNPDIGLKKRWKLFYSPKGLNFNEYIHFRKKFWKYNWIFFALKAYIRVLFPSIYIKFKS